MLVRRIDFSSIPSLFVAWQNGNTPLIWAAFGGFYDIVKILLDNEATPDCVNKVSLILLVTSAIHYFFDVQNGKMAIEVVCEGYNANQKNNDRIVDLLLCAMQGDKSSG
jgi:ankyrin repeat protein